MSDPLAVRSAPSVGLLMLPDTKVKGPGSMSDPDHYRGRVVERAVRDQPLERIVAGHAMADYIEAADRLALDGAGLITSNCGLSGLYQQSIQTTTGLPTVMTALMLAPLLLSVFGDPLAVVAFGSEDASRHLERLFPGQKVGERCRIVSIKGRPGMEWLLSADPAMPEWDGVRRSLERYIVPEILATDSRAVLVECTALLPVIDTIRQASERPTVTLSGFLRYLQSEVLGWQPNVT